MNKDATRILKRCNDGKPVINVDDYPGLAQVYNPTGVKIGGETIVVVSVVEHAGSWGIGRDVGQTRQRSGGTFEALLSIM